MTRIARFTAGAAVRLGKVSSISTNAELLRGPTLSTPSQTSEVRAGIGASVEPRTGSRVSVSGYAARRRVPTTIVERGIDLRWDQELPAGRRFSLMARSNIHPSMQHPGNSFRSEYTMPFGIPVARASSRGRVSGTIVRARTGKPMPGLLVRLGTQISMTDRAGRFAFSVDSELPVLLDVAMSAASVGSVALRDLPLEIQPRGSLTSTSKWLRVESQSGWPCS